MDVVFLICENQNELSLLHPFSPLKQEDKYSVFKLIFQVS